MIRYFETHCHLHYTSDDRADALERARAVGVERLITVSVDCDSMVQCRAIAEQHEQVYFSCGVHPHETSKWSVESDKQIRQTLAHPKAVAIGETGLDYFYEHSSKDQQIDAFRAHLRIAKDFHKPVIVHCRDARDDVLKVLKEEAPFPSGGVLHCFTETKEAAFELIKLGFFISLSGIITFKNAEPLRQVAQEVPLDFLLIETDAPYLAPIPYRGKKNEPAYVVEVARTLASLKKVGVEEIARVTWENATRLFLQRPTA